MQGKVKTQPPQQNKQPQQQNKPQKPPSAPGRAGIDQNNILHTVIQNKWQVELMTLDDRKYTGELLGYNNYEIVLSIEGEPIVFYKHYVKYFRPLIPNQRK